VRSERSLALALEWFVFLVVAAWCVIALVLL
jgi:hypothetical protein